MNNEHAFISKSENLRKYFCLTWNRTREHSGYTFREIWIFKAGKKWRRLTNNKKIYILQVKTTKVLCRDAISWSLISLKCMTFLIATMWGWTRWPLQPKFLFWRQYCELTWVQIPNQPHTACQILVKFSSPHMKMQVFNIGAIYED